MRAPEAFHAPRHAEPKRSAAAAAVRVLLAAAEVRRESAGCEVLSVAAWPCCDACACHKMTHKKNSRAIRPHRRGRPHGRGPTCEDRKAAEGLEPFRPPFILI